MIDDYVLIRDLSELRNTDIYYKTSSESNEYNIFCRADEIESKKDKIKRIIEDEKTYKIQLYYKRSVELEDLKYKLLHLDNANLSINEKTALIMDYSKIFLINTKRRVSYNNLITNYIIDISYELIEYITKYILSIESYSNIFYNFFKDEKSLDTEFNHSIQTTFLSLWLINSLNDSNFKKKSFLKYFGVGCLLHDVGKFLTSVEEDHPFIGYHLFQYNTNANSIVLNCVLLHHEYLDGSGYPLGKSIIPEYVQILTFCDTYSSEVIKHGGNKLSAAKKIRTMIDEKKLNYKYFEKLLHILNFVI